ncbi:MAG TPA: CusA/CzcA family heavy metal efflux RND transporter [Candidatus Saccharimonadales bacterium]|jgi:cobalt-zinc-cadmium resistance protein CzcA|nr:CusA/CzcA family heavy metal efflux RND transporter [Candidatus Saccharimonadales bacterium]
MIRSIVDFALNNRFIVLSVALVLFVWGVISFKRLPVEAYPDVANTWVQVITQWPGRAAEEVEQQITIPIEIQMNGIPHLAHVRSASLAGLSVVNLIFDDESDNDWDRQKVLERLAQVTLPTNVSAQIGPDFSPIGSVYWYTVKSTNPNYDLMELKSLQDWTITKYIKSAPDVVDDSSFGGLTREYQVRVDPDKLVSYGLSLAQVEQQLANSNGNGGGSFVEQGAQQINVRAVGLVRDVQDIEKVVLKTQKGTAISVKDIAVVTQGPKIRLGQIGRAIHRDDGVVVDENDVVEGIVFMRKGADTATTMDGIHAAVEKLNNHILPPGVKIIPYLDRDDLVHYTTHTVLHNLTEGMILVVIILFIFLGNVRGALIVSFTIPFALLFASICLDLRHISANLLSLGALDFGMVVDGAVVMIENISRHLNRPERDHRTPMDRIREAVHEVQRPVFYAIAIIITAYMPIFTLQQVEGKLFKPMAWTVAFALLGALVFSMLVAPALASLLFHSGVKEWKNPVMTYLTARYREAVTWSVRNRYVTVGTALVLFAFAMYLGFGGAIGSEFLPHLDEGAIWVRGTLAPSAGPTESSRVAERAREVLCSFPEVPRVVNQIGRPDDGTDTTGFFDMEFFVDLLPKDKWRPVFHQNKDLLIAAMNHQLEGIPGVFWGFSQPISDNLEEAVSGVKGALAVKIYGDDLKTLEATGDQIVSVMRDVRGVEDLGLFRVLGQPNLNFEVDRDQAKRFGINVSDVQDAIQTAVGGNALSQVLIGEQRYDLVLRYLPQYRDTREAIEKIRLLSSTGERVSLAQLTKSSVSDGGSEIYRENNSRYVAIKFSVRGRDLGTTVEEAIRKVNAGVKMPQGYTIDWAGEYESQKRSQLRLMIVLPVTIVAIFVILYAMFTSVKWALLILTNVAMAPLGGLLALLVTHTNLSVSSGVGFLALFGVSVQTGVIMVEYINQLRARGYTIERSAVEGAVLRLRPIMMTMLVATLGLLPAALSHDIGSDSQRPFAIVIVGGLMSNLVLGIFLLPTLYAWFARKDDQLPEPDSEGAV